LHSPGEAGDNRNVSGASEHQNSKATDPSAGNGSSGPETAARVVIKKYANRRLYNTATSGYVTLDSLAQMVRAGTDFVVFDARTGEDITRSVLTQIIFDEEGKGRGLLPIEFLRHLIRLYGDSLQTFVPSYLDMSMEALSRNQEQIRRYLGETLSGKTPLERFEGMTRQNLAFFERTMRMFAPFSPPVPEAARRTEGTETPPPSSQTERRPPEIEELQRQISAMQQQIDNLAKRS
jgi:polyhydroxyalkanoate synthesis repressor PhaR